MAEPSFTNGFASPWYGGMMKYPDLWRGCVGYWAPILGPTGATLFDVGGCGDNFPLTGFTLSTAWRIGQKGHQLYFNGSSAYATKATSFAYGTGDFTWQAIVNANSFASGNNYFLDHGVNGGLLSYTAGQLSYYNPATGLGALYNTGVTLNTNQIYVLTVVRASGTTKIYVDGKERASAADGQNYVGQALTLGRYGGSRYYYDGSYLAYGEWSRALSPSEMMLFLQRPGVILERDDELDYAAIEASAANRRRRLLTACGA